MTITRTGAGRGALAVATVLLMGSLGAMPAPAVGSGNQVKPIKGEYHDFDKAVEFEVVKDPRKIKSLSLGVGEDPCPGVAFVSYHGKVRVKNSGKFKYEGPASKWKYGDEPFEYFEEPTTIKFKGKFVSKKKAKGSFWVQDCIDVDFTAKTSG